MIFDLVRPFTMIGKAGVEANIAAVSHVHKHQIAGAIVECGVWKGGSMAAMAYRLIELGDTTRDLYLFDTFAGMSEPTEHDMKSGTNTPALERFQHEQGEDYNAWCYGSLNEVKDTMRRTKYPHNKLHYVVGKVEDTLPFVTGSIGILRLDTDFYESTRIELKYLYPLVVPGGAVIIDDYGAWQGARIAVQEYFNPLPNMQEVDSTRRVFYK